MSSKHNSLMLGEHGWKVSVLIRNSVWSAFSEVVFPNHVNPLIKREGMGGYSLVMLFTILRYL